MNYGDDPEDWLYDDEDDELDPCEEIEQAIQDCGLNEAADWCDLSGTEHCDFRCIFRHYWEKDTTHE